MLGRAQRATKPETKSLVKAMAEFESGNGIIVTGITKQEIVNGKKIKYIPLGEWLLAFVNRTEATGGDRGMKQRCSLIWERCHTVPAFCRSLTNSAMFIGGRQGTKQDRD